MAELDVELPKALIKRIVRAKLQERVAKVKRLPGEDSDERREYQINKDALAAFSQATKVFITYISSAAHDICRESKRSTVAAQDILKALEELEFEAFLPNLQELLEDIQNKRKALRDEGLPPRKVGRPSAMAMLARQAASQQRNQSLQASADLGGTSPQSAADAAPPDAAADAPTAEQPPSGVLSLFQ